MDEQRTAGVMYVFPRGEVYVSQRFHDIQEASRLDVDARAPQDPAEDQQVVEKE
jgi:hypothetical protein